MDYFKFDLQLFGVDYENPSTKTSGSRHAIVLNTAQYHAFKDGAGAPAAGKMNTYEGYNVLTNIPAEAGPYFYGVDGELYAMGDDAMQTALKNMIRNETDGTRPVTEHFFLGTVTTDAEGKVISVTSFDDQDNLWYGETVDILKGAAYTAKGSNYIYSVNGDTDAPMVFQLMYPYGGTGNQEFTVDAETGKVVDFGTAASPVNYVLLFTGDMVVDLSGSNKFPKNIIFMNGNDDANGSIDRGYTYGKRSKDQPHYVGALMMDSTKTASVTVTGQDSATDIKINNRSYNVTSGIKFVRDFADNEASTSVIASIAGTDGDDTVTILASASGHALDTDFAVSGDIDLGDGDDTLQLGDSTHAQNYGGAILLGKGDDTVTIDNGSKRIDVAGGITGGAGDDTYNFAKASAAVGDVPATEITINDFAKGDTLNLNGMTVMTTSAGGVAITAGQKGFTLGAATGITVTDATRTLTIADVAEGTEFTVSGIADLTGALVFTADDTSYVLTADTLTVMTAKGATVYTVTDQTNLSYTAATGKLVSTETPAGIEGAKNELTLTLGLTGIDVTEYDTDTNYYAVTYNKTTGQYAIGDAVATEPTTAVDPAKLVGYFAMTVNKNVNQPTATLEYYAKGATKPSSFISGLTVDATALTEVEIKAAVVEPPSAAVNAPFKKLDVTDISLGTVEVRNVATDVASVEGTDAKNVYYVTQYALSTTGGADTITLVKGGDTDATVCYAITATKSGTDNKPVVTYSIAKTQTGAPPAAGTAYFSVVYDPDGADGGSYGVTFFPNKDAEEKTNVASLTADCWAGIKVNAEALGNTGTLTITPNTAVDSYARSAA